MVPNVDEVVQRYAAAVSGAAEVKPLPPDAAHAWRRITTGKGRFGAARVRDSARRRWMVEAYREAARGRYLVVTPIHGDNEPFRASADGHRLDTHLRITVNEWSLLALLVCGHEGDEGLDDEELRNEAFRLVDRLVIEAQHRALMGAAEEED